MENAEVWKRAIVDKKIFSKIKNNVNYHPNKLTALCLCVGAKLNLDESKDLLARAGYALSPCDKTDIIFSYFIENEIYDMIELDIQLEEHGLPCIISQTFMVAFKETGFKNLFRIMSPSRENTTKCED